VTWLVVIGWPIVALLFALAMGRAIRLGEERDREIAAREIAARTHPEIPEEVDQ